MRFLLRQSCFHSFLFMGMEWYLESFSFYRILAVVFGIILQYTKGMLFMNCIFFTGLELSVLIESVLLALNQGNIMV